jgi:protein TonB
METKKSPKANLESKRGSFLLIGLLLATVVTYFVINLKNENVKTNSIDFATSSAIDEEQTVITKETPIRKEEIKKVNISEIEIVDNKTKITTIFEFPEEEQPIEFDIEDFEFPDEEIEDGGKIFDWAETAAVFPGGEIALRTFIANNVKYPEMAINNEVEGTVYLRFVVTKTGKVGEVQVLKSVDPILDQEAIRVVKKLPDFKPAFHNGRPVNCWFSLPIVFELK